MNSQKARAPISAWSWVTASSTGHFIWPSAHSDGPPPWEASGLSPHPESLGLPGYWGRVQTELKALPPELALHESRCADLLLRALGPLIAQLEALSKKVGPGRIGVVLGSSTGGIDATEAALRHERAHGKMPASFVFEEAHVYHALIRVVQGIVGLSGPGYVVSTACSSSGKALAAGRRLLASGACDAVLTGGVDALCEMTVRGFGGLGILSGSPCRPFDGSRNGINIGEGAALVLLERDTDSPYALLGSGESGDAYHLTAPHPQGLGARLAIERALEDSGLQADAIGYVNAHGTGTKQNDQMESTALSAVFPKGVRFSSTKDRTGHQLGAAGGVEAIFCLEALRRQTPPNNCPAQSVDADLPLQPTRESVSEHPSEVRAILSNSFAFGGSNVCIALGKNAPTPLPTAAPESPLYVRAVSAWADGYPDALALTSRTPQARGLPPPAELLAPRARGRASQLTRIFAELYGQLRGPVDAPRFDVSEAPLVCASAYGEMQTTIRLLDQLLDETTLSPARFQASVHNTAQGLLSIATENRAFSTALAAGHGSVAMAFVEAAGYLSAHDGDIVVLVADEDGPTRLLHGETFPALGVGFLLSLTPGPTDLGVIRSIRETPTAPIAADLHDFSRSPAYFGIGLVTALVNQTFGTFPVGYRWQADVHAANS